MFWEERIFSTFEVEDWCVWNCYGDICICCEGSIPITFIIYKIVFKCFALEALEALEVLLQTQTSFCVLKLNVIKQTLNTFGNVKILLDGPCVYWYVKGYILM